MELIMKPYYNKESCFIDTDKSFTESFDYEIDYNDFYFKAGFNLYPTDEDYEEKDVVATVEGVFFKYNLINEFDIDIIDLADSISDDTYKAIITLEDNSLFAKADIEYMSLVCYLSRLYIYPEYRNNGIATYIYENLQEIFECVTGDQISIFITLPCPQKPTLDGRWKNIRDDIMFEKMVRLLNKHKFKPVGDGFYYKSYT